MNPDQPMSASQAAAPQAAAPPNIQTAPNTSAHDALSVEQQGAVDAYTEAIRALSIGNNLHGKIRQLSATAEWAIKRGDLPALQHELASGNVLVYREVNEGNLLDFSIQWLHLMLHEGIRDLQGHPTSPGAIARMGMWLVDEGLVPSREIVEQFEPKWPKLQPVPPEDVRDLGYFLAIIHEGQPPVRRILRALGYAVWHHGQLSMKDSVVTNIGQIDGCNDLSDAIDNVVAPIEEKYWSDGEIIGPGIEAVIAKALLQYELSRRLHGLPLTKSDLDFILQGPRTVILRLVTMVLAYPMIVPNLVYNVIVLCWPMPVFIGAFGDITSLYALRHGALDFWKGVLKRHKPNAEYLQVKGLTYGYSKVMAEWEEVEESVRVEGSKFYKLHWESVAQGGLRDFEKLLKPYVKAEYSQDLYGECEIFYENVFWAQLERRASVPGSVTMNINQ